jgi:NhaA family Na+:H+ antiporter
LHRNVLAFASTPEVADEGTLAVLRGSSISIALSPVLVSRLAAYYRRLRMLRDAARHALGST